MVRKGEKDATMRGKGKKKVSAVYIILKVIMWVLIVFFATDSIMQFISYSFYKGDKRIKNVDFKPEEIQINDSLSGYGYNLDADSDKVILFFGGSMYIAYNTVGMYGGRFDSPMLSVDYYGTQNSKGKMNLRTMQQSAEELYDYAKAKYPDKDIYIFGHSYGCGMAAYLASVRECKHLVLASGYRTSADMYNKIKSANIDSYPAIIENTQENVLWFIEEECRSVSILKDVPKAYRALDNLIKGNIDERSEEYREAVSFATTSW